MQQQLYNCDALHAPLPEQATVRQLHLEFNWCAEWQHYHTTATII